MAEVAAIILAAGQSSRFRATSALATKLIAPYRGEPMILHVARLAIALRAAPVVVVTGHARQQVEAALSGLPVVLVHNPGFASGLAGSLRMGIAALPATCAGALILLGDMPAVKASTCHALLEAFGHANKETSAVVPVWQGQIGNPVLLSRALFGRVSLLEGDQGARRLLPDGTDTALMRVEVEDENILADADTAQALAALQAIKE